MQDIINSFKAHLYERTSSPLLGAFIFYWIIFNYKLLIVIFSDLKPIEKFNEITSSVYPTLSEQVGFGLILPIGFTLIYILYFPKVSNKIHKKWIEHQNELKEISNGKVLTEKEFGELRQQFSELELSFDDKFQKKDSEILKLKSLNEKKDNLVFEYQSKIESFEKIISSKDNEINNIRNDLNNYHIELNHKNEEISNLKQEVQRLSPNTDILENEIMKLYIPNYNANLTLNYIKTKLNHPELKVKYIIKQLTVKHGFLQLVNETSQGKFYSGYKLTDKGENFLVENNYIE